MLTLPQVYGLHKGLELVPKDLMKKKERMRRELRNCDMVKCLKWAHENVCCFLVLGNTKLSTYISEGLWVTLLS